FLAIEAVIRYSRAGDEEAVVRNTERLGSAHSPLTTEELLEALEDPRFSVRFEAIIAMARVGFEPRLVEALAGVMEGPEPALSTVAAWALGRMGDASARPALERGLESRYRSVQAHSSRSLGVLNDRDAIPELLARLQEEADPGLQLAYASTLGQMKVDNALPPILSLLATARNRTARAELALAAARIVGDEAHFIQMLRQARREPGTALAQAMIALRKRVEQMEGVDGELLDRFDACALALARNQLNEGVACLTEITHALIPLTPVEYQRGILVHCAEGMEIHGTERIEFPVLTLHTLAAG
ncbi:MAG: HEAT repeat domain-containing protein, partial [Anaerolineae bacterium]|nr:HEAT repeat domain-containing protein [Anaerolineae bacterium]